MKSFLQFRFIRWSYVASRLPILALILLAMWLSLNPGLRWLLIYSGQSAIGAKVEIGSLHTNLSSSRVELTDVAVADPRRPMSNLFEIDSAEFDLETSAALRKRLVIHEGRLSGVQLHTQRTTSGQLEKTEEEETSNEPGMSDKIGQMGEEWVNSTLDKLETDVESELHSIRLAKELKERWPNDYKAVERQADDLKDRGEQLADVIEQLSKKPLDHLDKIEPTMVQLDRIRQDGLRLKNDLQRIRQQVQQDKLAIEQAKRHDEQYIKEKLRLENLDGQSLTEYLIGPELHERLTTTLGWIRWVRAMTSTETEAQKQAESQPRGENILFPGMLIQPDVLIKTLIVDGTGTIDEQPFTFLANIHDITHQSKKHDQPITINLKAQGSAEMYAKAILDRRGDVPTEQVLIEIPALVQQAKTLGNPEKLAVNVGRGKAHIRANLTFEDENVVGRIEFRQANVQMEPSLPEAERKQVLLTDLKPALQHVSSLDIQA
ncbi:MAG: TIGR03545 family protein, partial [Planctomycetales bacterium]|nr:TIGR03545 family protein [Planctomycetales bacterium]